MNLICLHFQSKAEFFINPVYIEHMEWMPAERMTAVTIVGRNGGYKCIETPDEIHALIIAATNPTMSREEVDRMIHAASVGGVGGQGPVYGDGSAVEKRDDDVVDGGGGCSVVGRSAGSSDAGGPRVHGMAPKSESDIPPPWHPRDDRDDRGILRDMR